MVQVNDERTTLLYEQGLTKPEDARNARMLENNLSHISHLREYLSYCTVPYHLLTFSLMTSPGLRRNFGNLNQLDKTTQLKARQTTLGSVLRCDVCPAVTQTLAQVSEVTSLREVEPRRPREPAESRTPRRDLLHINHSPVRLLPVGLGV
eukprot:765167-Hanusia_phi.AAC.2